MNQDNKTPKSLSRSYPTLLLAMLVTGAGFSTSTQAHEPGVDRAATTILKRMTGYIAGLKQFSVHTQSTVEDVLASGHRVDIDVSARATVSRPNKIRAERLGELVDQTFFYDGKTLTLHNPSDNVYASVPAPATIEGTLDYARDTLELIIPVSDLVYSNAYSLLMQDVTFATVIGKSFINGVKCDQLLFSRPGVDFQVWVADSGKPLPMKYVVTDTGNPGQLSLTTVMSHWNTAPAAKDADFKFTPPAGAKPIDFLPLYTTNR